MFMEQRIVTKAELLKLIQNASRSHSQLVALRNYVFDFYYDDCNYIFDDKLINVFTVLCPYLLFEEARGDTDFSLRLRRLAFILQNNGAMKPCIILAIYYDEIKTLHDSYSNKLLSENTYKQKLKELSGLDCFVSQMEETIGQYHTAIEMVK